MQNCKRKRKIIIFEVIIDPLLAFFTQIDVNSSYVFQAYFLPMLTICQLLEKSFSLSKMTDCNIIWGAEWNKTLHILASSKFFKLSKLLSGRKGFNSQISCLGKNMYLIFLCENNKIFVVVFTFVFQHGTVVNLIRYMASQIF